MSANKTSSTTTPKSKEVKPTRLQRICAKYQFSVHEMKKFCKTYGEDPITLCLFVSRIHYIEMTVRDASFILDELGDPDTLLA